MKICFFIYNISNAGGSERVTVLIANELKRRGYDVSILSICGKDSFYELDKEIIVEIIYKDIHNINSKKKYFDILRKAYKYHKNNKTDIVIDVFASRSLISIPLKALLKLKNITWEHFNYSAKIGLNPLGRKLACKYSNKIITLTKEDISLFKQDNKMIASIDYIYNPTPFENNKVSNLNNNNIISVGRLSSQKGYDMLLNAWSIVEKNSDLNLIIVGDGDERDNLDKQVKELNLKNVSFAGITNDISRFYLNSCAYVSSSRYEGLPMCMIEAQSFGLPLVSFKCKTGPSEIIKNEITGYLVENGNCKELAEKILELVKDREKLKKMAIKSKEDSSRFKIHTIIDKWEMAISTIK